MFELDVVESIWRVVLLILVEETGLLCEVSVLLVIVVAMDSFWLVVSKVVVCIFVIVVIVGSSLAVVVDVSVLISADKTGTSLHTVQHYSTTITKPFFHTNTFLVIIHLCFTI